jgi:hypothetical protein
VLYIVYRVSVIINGYGASFVKPTPLLRVV